MSISIEQKRKIVEVVSVFETGNRMGDYSQVTVLKDWQRPDKVRYYQITYGRMQTTESNNLKKLLTMYVSNQGIYTAGIAAYLPRIGKFPSLYQDQNLITLLKEAGKNDPIMIKTQNDFFDEVYWVPALNWFTTNGFAKALSMMVIFDSFIHSGGILGFLRKRFSAVPPVKGGAEADWISQYVEVRHQWLATHADAILQKTVYRTNCFKQQMASNNWDLNGPINANKTTVI